MLTSVPSSETQGQVVGAHGLFSPFFTFLRAIFSRPFRLSLAPTICPWVSEDASVLKTKLKNGDKFVLTFPDCGNIPVFGFENPRGTLYTLKISDTVLMERLPYEFTSCEVYLNSSWFLGCNGVRLQQNQYIRKMKELFTFFRAPPILRTFFLRVRVTIL